MCIACAGGSTNRCNFFLFSFCNHTKERCKHAIDKLLQVDVTGYNHLEIVTFVVAKMDNYANENKENNYCNN